VRSRAGKPHRMGYSGAVSSPVRDRAQDQDVARSKRIAFVARRHDFTWPLHRPDPWLAEPSFWAGAGSLVDIMGAATWYDPSRLTPFGSRRALASDTVMIARDFRHALRETLKEHSLEVEEDVAPRLFDPDDF
jgi:hypothetical protein